MLIDPAKVHTIDHRGEYYASRGPLNSGPCPQGRPVIAQAGGSAKGRAIAAQYADTIVAHPKGVEAMKAYRDDVRARMAAAGRDPDTCKVLFMATPVLANTDEEAQARAAQRGVATTEEVQPPAGADGLDHQHRLLRPRPGCAGGRADHQRAPVEPGQLPAQGRRANAARGDPGLYQPGGSVDLVGSPDTVAAQMDEAMQEVGGDGFLLVLPNVSRKTVMEITDGLVPALQQRGIVRRGYTHKHLRDTLLEF